MTRTLHPRALMNQFFAMLVSAGLVMQLSFGGMSNGLASRIESANFLSKIEAEFVAIARTDLTNGLRLSSPSLSNWGGLVGGQSEFAVSAVLPLVGVYGADAWRGPKGKAVNGFHLFDEVRIPNDIADSQLNKYNLPSTGSPTLPTGQ